MSSLEDMKEITKRLIFGLRQSLQLIDLASSPWRQTPVQRTIDNFAAKGPAAAPWQLAPYMLPLTTPKSQRYRLSVSRTTTKHYLYIHESIQRSECNLSLINQCFHCNSVKSYGTHCFSSSTQMIRQFVKGLLVLPCIACQVFMWTNWVQAVFDWQLPHVTPPK